MTTKRFGRVLGTVMIVLAVVGISSVTAYADSTCYVGCTTGGGGGGSTGGGGGGTPPPVTKAAGSGSGSSLGSGSGKSASGTGQSTKSSGGTLPFTGADVEELTIGGVGALLAGGLLVRRSRNRRRLPA